MLVPAVTGMVPILLVALALGCEAGDSPIHWPMSNSTPAQLSVLRMAPTTAACFIVRLQEVQLRKLLSALEKSDLALLIFVCTVSVLLAAGALPTAADFLEQQCGEYSLHEGLVHQVLRPYSGVHSLTCLIC